MAPSPLKVERASFPSGGRGSCRAAARRQGRRITRM